ncbi:hypothetical protein HN014_08080 [Aquimarina sp. TRL1]|uniref:hypothetical protein n=1 Tax=Aquimarina sp. (strain TRL1) TaxID=2736252 RepID=UPI00158F4C5E|nr:hypothetical protein [Aquimarina sp. TRL1]QKX04876.1 hypothetical protein HN014_08080 [Aquimarina sp. TRL1]
MNTPIPLADAPCADFHLSSYLKVFRNRKIKLQRRWFRGAAKSIHTNVGNVTHLKENNELNFGLIIGRAEKQSKLLLADVQAHLGHNERYIKDFGMQMQYGSWADGAFETNDNKFFMALGLNQPFRGLRKGADRPDFASMDDLEDREAAKNKELTAKKVEKITGDLGKAGHKDRFRQIMPNNYIVKDGIVDGWAKKNKDSKNFEIETINLCDADFNPSWQQRYTSEECMEIVEDSDYYTSQREDFNTPIEEGKQFKEKEIRFKKVHGNKHWDCLVEFWDLSFTEGGDYKAGVVLGFENGKAHVLELFYRQCESSVAMDKHFQWQGKYNARGMAINSYYDATASQKAVHDPNWLIACERNGGSGIPLPDHATGDKHERIVATLKTMFFNRLLTFDERLRDSEDMEQGIIHILAFEKKCSSPDDLLDALECAVRKGRLLFGAEISSDTSKRKPIIRIRTRGGF